MNQPLASSRPATPKEVKGIALEAALGEDNDNDGITERLADRCAFLLHKTPEERKRTRQRMRDIYKLRSKLVHGAKTALSREDDELAMWGGVHLNAVLATELHALEGWWRQKQRRSGS
jgi:hypothetical protein